MAATDKVLQGIKVQGQAQLQQPLAMLHVSMVLCAGHSTQCCATWEAGMRKCTSGVAQVLLRTSITHWREHVCHVCVVAVLAKQNVGARGAAHGRGDVVVIKLSALRAQVLV